MKVMTQSDIKALASEVIGDGGTPNMFFVTTCSNVFAVDAENVLVEVGPVEGFEDADFSHTYGPFYSYSEARKVYDEQDLDTRTGVCQVVMEDRATGTITERFLKKIVRVDFIEDSVDYSKTFGYK